MLHVHRRGARRIVALPPRALADKFDSFIVTAVGESCERGSTFRIVAVAEACVGCTGCTGCTGGKGCTGCTGRVGRTGRAGNPAILSWLGGTIG